MQHPQPPESNSPDNMAWLGPVNETRGFNQISWLSPLRDIPINRMPTSLSLPNLNENPIDRIDADLFSERANNTSDNVDQSTNAEQGNQGILPLHQNHTWPYNHREVHTTEVSQRTLGAWPAHYYDREPLGNYTERNAGEHTNRSSYSDRADSTIGYEPQITRHEYQTATWNPASNVVTCQLGAWNPEDINPGNNRTSAEFDPTVMRPGINNNRMQNVDPGKEFTNCCNPQTRTEQRPNVSTGRSAESAKHYGDVRPEHSRNPYTWPEFRPSTISRETLASTSAVPSQLIPTNTPSTSSGFESSTTKQITTGEASPTFPESTNILRPVPEAAPSTSSGFESSTYPIKSYGQINRHRSPIRFPTPDPPNPGGGSELGWDTNNPNIHTRSLRHKSRTVGPVRTRSETSQSPIRDHRSSTVRENNIHRTPIHQRSYEARTGTKHRPDTSTQAYSSQQTKRRCTSEEAVNTFLEGIRGDIKQIITNAHQRYPNSNIRTGNPEVHHSTGNAIDDNTTASKTRITAATTQTTGNSEGRRTVQAVRRRPIQQHDNEGVSNFHLDDNGIIVRTLSGHPRCNYCFIASHPRIGCKYRKKDLSNGIKRAVHPNKGHLQSIKSTQDVTKRIILVSENINGLPNEIINKIGRLLTFKDRCRFGATNKRFRFVLSMPEFWRKINIPKQNLRYTVITRIIENGTRSLSIPWSTVHGEWSENRELKDTIYTASSLEFLDLSGCNESTTVRGDDKTLALLVAKSKNLRVLDLTMAKLQLLNNIANTLPWGHRLTSLNLSVVANNQNRYLLKYETIKMIVDRLAFLEDIILVGADLCRQSTTYVCTYLTENIRRINFATERVRNSDIIALTNQCPRITYLNLTGTLVTYEVVHRIVTAWRNTMAYLCLPHGIATHLELPSEDISNYINLENLSNLWMRHIVNSNDDPILSTLAEFQMMIDSMTELQYFNIGNHSGMMPQNLLGIQHHTKTLRRLFRHLTINISPYEDRCPIEEDPYSIFKNRYSYRGTSTNSNPSASPSSTASTVSIEDFNQ